MFANVMRNGGGHQTMQNGSHVTQIQLIGGGPYGMRFDRIGNSGPVFVAKMHRRSKARAAGVEIGDVILSVNGHDCSHATADYVTELVSRISSTSPDLVLRLSRGGIYSLESTAAGEISDNGFSSNTRHHQHQQQQQHKPYHTSQQQQQQQQQQQYLTSYPPYMPTTATTTTTTASHQQHTSAQRFPPQSGGKLHSSMISSGNSGHANQYSKLTTMMSMTSPESTVRRASFQSDVEDVDGTGTSTRRHVTALVLPPTSGEKAHVVLNSQTSSHQTVSSVQSTNYYHNDESDVELAMTHRRGQVTDKSHLTTTSRQARPATAPPPSEVMSSDSISSDATSWQYSRPTRNLNNSFDGYHQQPLLQPSRVQNNESRDVTSGFPFQQSETQRGSSAVAFGTSSNAATGSSQKWKPVLWQPSKTSSPGVTHQSVRPDVVNNANAGSSSFLHQVNSNAGHRRASDADAWNKRPNQFYNESTTTTADVAYQTPRHAPMANLNQQLQLPLSTPRDRHSVDIVFGRETGPAGDHHVNREDNEVIIWSSKPAVETTPSTAPAKNNLLYRPQSAAAGFYQPPVSSYKTAAFDADNNGGNSANFYSDNNFRPQETQSTYPVNVAVDDFNDFETNFADRSQNAGHRVTASIGSSLDQQASQQQSWQGTDRQQRRSEQLSHEEDFRQYQQRSQTLPRQQPRFEKPEVVQAAPTSAFPLQSGRRQSAPVADHYVTPSSHYLSRSGFVEGGSNDLLAPIQRKKLYADSSFYEDADRIYPTIEEQIKMARKVAQLLMASHSTSGRGQQMFVKRQQLADQWTTESIAGQPFYPRQRRPAQRPPSINGWSGGVQNQAAELAELDRLRNCAEKTRHDIVPPVIGAQIAAELQRTSATGNTMAGRMFARRRERSERYVVPEVNCQRRPKKSTPIVHSAVPERTPQYLTHSKREPPPTAKEPPQTYVPLPETVTPPAPAMRRTVSQPQVNMVPPVSDGPLPVPRLLQMIEMPRAAMTPWEAAAQFEGRVEPAFDHLVKYREAARVAWTAPRDDDYIDEPVDGTRGRPRNGGRVDGGSRNTAVSNVDYQTDVEMDSYYSHHQQTNQTPTSRRARSACPTPVTSSGRRQLWTPTAGAYSRPVPAASTGVQTIPYSYPSPSTPASAAASWSRATTPANPVSHWSGDYGDAYRPSTNAAYNRYGEYGIGQRQPHFGYQLQS